jgi:RNA polymerase sigma-70 factor, ECF subfamily
MGVALQTSIPGGPAERNGLGLDSAEGAAAMSAWRFKLAVVQHDRIVYRTARALLRDDREAEDVVQETFLRYWELGSGVEHARAWLLKVARNACLDRLRKSSRLVSHEEEAPPEPSEHRDPAWHYQHGELAANLQRLVDTLSEPQRSLIVLFDLHGVDGPACARILGLSATQVKVYLHRARRRLRAQLEQQS